MRNKSFWNEFIHLINISIVQSMIYSNINEIETFTLDEYVEVLKQAQKEIKNNKVISIEDLKLEIEKW